MRHLLTKYGNPSVNQIVVSESGSEVFYSYNTKIATIGHDGKVTLTAHWDYSVTTSNYRNQFLGENKAATAAKIASGEYIIQ